MLKITIKLSALLLLMSLVGCVLINPKTLDFGSDETTKTFKLTVIGDVEWSINYSESWLTVEPDSGQSTDTITVTVDRKGLDDGSYEAVLNITTTPDISCPDVIVKMTVGNATTFTTTTTSLTTTPSTTTTTATSDIDDGWWYAEWLDDVKTFRVEYEYHGWPYIPCKGDGGWNENEAWNTEKCSGTDQFNRSVEYNHYEYRDKREGATTWYRLTRDTTVSHDSGFLYESVLTQENDNPISETFSGTLPGGMTFSGHTSIIPEETDISDWTQLVIETEFYYNNNLYANCVMEIIFEYYITPWKNKRYLSEEENTKIDYSDGSWRVSEIKTVYEYDDDTGNMTNKSSSGTVTGSEIVNGFPFSYDGSITISYNKGKYFIESSPRYIYEEVITTGNVFPKRLPLEIVFGDDHYIRAAFYFFD